jgi:antitoxin component YwqK of YwqJK toxin-antitoxin module
MAKNSNPNIEHIKNYYPKGNVSSEHYYLNNLLHRTDGPAIIDYYDTNGNISSKVYYVNVTNDKDFLKWQKRKF